jgi:phosphate transport system permease protein
MSSDAPLAGLKPKTSPRRQAMPSPAGRRRLARLRTSLLAHGEPMLWLTGGALALALTMIAGLLALVFLQGFDTFWPVPLVEVRLATDKTYLGEVTRDDDYRPSEAVLAALPADVTVQARARLAATDGMAHRRLFRTGNFELTQTHFHWVGDILIAEELQPEWAVVVERLTKGRAYGVPERFELAGEVAAKSPPEIWALFQQHHPTARQRWRERRRLEKVEIGAISRDQEEARVAAIAAGLRHGTGSAEHRAAEEAYRRRQEQTADQHARVMQRIAELDRENDRYQLILRTAGGEELRLALADIVRAYPPNRMGWSEKLAVYASRWWEFLTDEPREANSEGGVLPAIFGTVAMTMLMSLAVVPFGVLAALYLREYAKGGSIVSAVRIAINNLAGVPSIVFGVFGLGFFCYWLGGEVIDPFLFSARLPRPTYGTGGLLWASLTLALLTLPVVIVATEEALAAVPNSMREGSYACGAGKWQTIRRIVLPRALPGIMTGMILAMARGAGEVAPLMLVGAVKLAPDLVVDGVFPFIHPERSFMHLGFHIYDVGFQSQNSEAAKPMVFTTTLLLILVIALLNVSAVWLRGRLRRRFVSAQF